MPQEQTVEEVLKLAAKAAQGDHGIVDWTPTGGMEAEKAVLKTAGEQLFGALPGNDDVIRRIIRAQPGKEEKSLGGKIAESFSRRFPGLPGGKKTSIGDLDNLAKSDPDFGGKWNAARQAQREAQATEALAYGREKPDYAAIQQKYADAVVEQAKKDGTFEEDVAPKRGFSRVSGDFFHEAPVLDQWKQGTRAKALEAARNGFPGLTRPPPTDDELVQAALGDLHGEAKSKRDEVLPWGVQAGVRGVVEGAKMLGPMRAAGTAAKALGASRPVAAAAGGAAVSAMNQSLSIASGAQDRLSVGALVQDAVLMGLGEKVGALASVRFPRHPGLANTVGQLGTMEAGNAILATDGGAPSDHPIRDKFERGIETAAMLGTAHALGVVGKPGKDQLAKIALSRVQREAEAAKNRVDTDYTGLGLHDNILSALDASAKGVSGGRLSVAPRNTVKGEIQGEVTDATLDFGIDLDRRLADWTRWRAAASGGDAVRGLAIDETVRRMVENGGQMPPETVEIPLPKSKVEKGPEQPAEPTAKEITKEIRPEPREELRKALRHIERDVATANKRTKGGPAREKLVEDAYLDNIAKTYGLDFNERQQIGIHALDVLTRPPEESRRNAPNPPRPDLLGVGIEAPEGVGEVPPPREPASAKPPAPTTKSVPTKPVAEHGLTPEQLQVGYALQLAAGEAMLPAGKILSDINAMPYGRYEKRLPDGTKREDKVFKREVDQGYRDVRDEKGKIIPGQRGESINPEDLARGVIGGEEGWSLVGGYKFHEGRGFWLPIKGVDLDLSTTPEQGAYTGPKHAKSPVQAPLAGGAWDYLKRRKASVEEALLDPTRLLDFSPEASATAGRIELEAARRGLTLEGYKRRGWLRYDHELPQADDVPEMRKAQQALESELDSMKKAFLKEPSREAMKAINAKVLEIKQLREEMNGTRFKQIPDDPKRWGQYAGMWIDRAAWADMQQLFQKRGTFEKLYDAIHSAVKGMKFMSGGQMAQQLVGNVLHTSLNGVYLAEHPAEVQLALAEQRPSSFNDPNRSKFGREFDTQTRGHNLGGSADIATQDVDAKPSRLKRAAGAANVIGKGVAYVDRATARATYYIERTNGATPAEAMAKVTEIFDYSTLPGWVRPAAKYFSYMRWPTKFLQTAGNVMKSRPRILGEPIRTPMDSAIESQNGNGKAQAALVARGIANLVLHASKVMLPLHAYQALKKEDLGIGDKQLDDYIESEDEFKRLPAWLRKAVKYTWIPTGITPLGRIEGHNFLALHPAMQALSYFSAGVNGRSVGDVLWQYGQKSVLGGPALQAAASKNYGGKNVGSASGGKPGGRYWSLENLLTPTAIQQPVEAYFNEMNVPPSERDPMRQMLRTLGDPVQALKPPPSMDVALRFINRFKDEGVVIMETPAEGGEYPKVARDYVGTPKGMQAQFWLDQFADNPQSYYGFMMKMWREQQGMKRQAENVTK